MFLKYLLDPIHNIFMINFFSISAKDIAGKLINFEIFKGKKAILVVNVASKWGLTKSDYTALSALYSDYSHKGLEIIGCPCNQFGGQEPWSE